MTKTEHIYEYLKFVNFKDFFLWDVKRFVAERITSNFPIVSLGKYIKEENTKIRPALEPEKEHKILGVNNIDGIFDAYTQLGKEIKQPYKIMKDGFLAYNPYRINVGSIGLKSNEHKNDLISSAYVVFSCKNGLNPEFLYKLFKTDRFNKVIRDSTTGSVRQNLTIDILRSLEIPLPSLTEQAEILAEYNAKIEETNEAENNGIEQLNIFQQRLIELLKIEIPKKNERIKKFLYFENFANLERWDVWNNKDLPFSKAYDNVEFEKIISSSPMYGANTKSAKTNSDIRYLRITDINEDGSLNEEVVQAKDEDPKYLLEENDFLLARSGTVGKSFLYKSKFGKCLFAGYLVKYKLNTEKVIPEYVFAYTKGIIFREWIKSNQRISVQPNINGQEYLKSPFVLPDKSVQQKVVEEFKYRTENYYIFKEQARQLKEQAIKDFEAKIFKN